MHTLVRILGALLALAIVVAIVEVVHPKGAVGLVRGLVSGAPPPAPAAAVKQGTATTPPATANAPPVVVSTWGPGATKELSWADRDYDRGDFDGAVSNYGSSRVLAANEDERYRAVKGLEKSLLAWAIARGAPKVDGKPSELDAAYQRQLVAVEANSDEKAWIDLVRWTAGAGLRDRLPYVVGQALDRARPGGRVQALLDDTLSSAGSKRELLAGAMASRGLGKGPPIAAIPVPGRPAPTATSGIGKTTTPTKPAEVSGIGGVNGRGIPFGRFTADTRLKLRKAIELEKQGTTAYRAAGPDDPKRVENRHAAMKCLKEARDIYQAALEEDGDSRDLDERLKDVMLMIAQLRKDEGVSEK